MLTKPRSPIFALLVLFGCGGRSVSLEGSDADPNAGSPGSPAGGTSGGPSGEGARTSGGSAGTSSGGSGDADDGGASSAGAPTATGGAGGSAGSNDPNCYPGLAVSGAECTRDCSVPCGLGDLGTRTCTCTGGYYSSCHCPRPPGYLGAPTAPPCDTPDGRALPLRHLPCDVEWAQCIGTDPVEGSIPRGCACLENPLNGDELTWFCGSTSRWFAPE